MAVKNTDRMLNLSRDLSTTGAPNSGGGGGGGRKNLIINGAMQVAQRGIQETGITSTDYYTVDRFQFVPGAATFTMDQNTVTDLPGFTKSCKVTCTTNGTLSANQVTFINTRLEAQDLQHLKKGTSDAESLTLSFWVKSDVTGTYTFELYEDDNARSIGATYTIDAAGTWEYKTITFAGDTTGTITNDNGIGFYLDWFLGAGSNYSTGTFNTSWHNYLVAERVSSAQVEIGDTIGQYFEITGVQLEVGDTATSFEHQSFGEELALCQRYYYKHAENLSAYVGPGWAYSTSSAYLQIDFPVTMRATPDAIYSNSTSAYTFYSNGSANNVDTFTVGSGTETSMTLVKTGLSGLTAGTAGGWYAPSGLLAFESEL